MYCALGRIVFVFGEVFADFGLSRGDRPMLYAYGPIFFPFIGVAAALFMLLPKRSKGGSELRWWVAIALVFSFLFVCVKLVTSRYIGGIPNFVGD